MNLDYLSAFKAYAGSEWSEIEKDRKFMDFMNSRRHGEAETRMCQIMGEVDENNRFTEKGLEKMLRYKSPIK
jgi:hypothetical protein